MMSDRSYETWTRDDRGCDSGAGGGKVSARANLNRSGARSPRMSFSPPEYQPSARSSRTCASAASTGQEREIVRVLTEERDIGERACPG